MNIAFNYFILLFIFSIFSCNSVENQQKEKEKQELILVQQEKAKRQLVDEQLAKERCEKGWAYGRVANGPHVWEHICPEFAPCGGELQSPVNIYNTYINKDLEKLEFDYKKNPINFEFKDHTIVINVEPNNYMLVKGKKYLLKQIHFHSMSEHMVEVKHYPMEIHFVHEGPGGFQAILAVFIDNGKENPFLKKYADKFPKGKGNDLNYESSETFDLNVLLPKNKSYYKYYGSLSEPPCTENVAYYVLKKPITFSQEVKRSMNRILGNNFRNVQPLHGRTISEFNE